MATVFKKRYTKPLPENAELFVRKGKEMARWTDRSGSRQIAEIARGKNGEPRVSLEARTYTAQYRDAEGLRREVATGCRDRTAAQGCLNTILRQEEMVKSNLISREELQVSSKQQKPVETHIEDYLTALKARGASPKHRDNVRRQLARAVTSLQIRDLRDFRRQRIERWLGTLVEEGASSRTRNSYLATLKAFLNWSREDDRLASNPLERARMLTEQPTRRRRALTDEEIGALLLATERRPLAEAKLIRRGENRGEMSAELQMERETELRRLGRERALIYKTLILTGLRKSELASIRLDQVDLRETNPCIYLRSGDAKNRKEAFIPLHSALAGGIRQWLQNRVQEAQRQAEKSGTVVPAALPPDAPLFYVPTGLSRIFNRDLEWAGIEKKDRLGRVVDVHSLRHTFGTLLSRAGVSPRTAQAAMRHSDIDLTMNVYTDPTQLDVRGAVDSLLGPPSQPNAGESGARFERNLAPFLAPLADFQGQSRTNADQKESEADSGNAAIAAANKGKTLKKKAKKMERETRFELATSSLGSWRSTN